MTLQLVAYDEELWRRIHPDHYVSGRVSSGAFTPTEMSVDIARLREHMRLTLEGGESVGVVAFSSTVAYDKDQQVISDPHEDNEAHALVIGNKSQSVRNALRNASTFFPSAEIA